ncbi:MAG: alpha/beta hydrolase [Gordonia sp. (in: high G+C Gram-positive bacteria)]|uniref:alpha/beta hydrolase family protein n=1 Tax=Gordonia sp. (in: high G+C Gram-positive bacteria) TaxID=84139 RepID=UPI0039E33FD7
MSTSDPEVTRTVVTYDDGPDADPEQDFGALYLPPGPLEPGSVPLVVLVHGGAWKLPGSAGAVVHVARDLAARGTAVYNIEYRRIGAGGGWPETFDDVARAVDFTPRLLAEHPELAGAVTVAGHSSGAQLATWAGTRGSPAFRPDRVVSLAGPLDMATAVADGDEAIVEALGGTPAQVPDRYARVDPIRNLAPGVPVLAVHGTDDRIVLPHCSENYVSALNDAGGDGRQVLLDGAHHTSFLEPDDPHYPRILDLIAGR